MQTKGWLAVTAVTLWITLSPSAHAQSQATAQSVQELMTLTGAGNLGMQMMNTLLPNLQRMAPQVPASFWQEFAKEIDPNELVAIVVPIYQRHFTESEIQEMIRFYKTPTGQKFTRELPLVTQESVAAGQQWGQQIAQRAIAKLQAQGIKPQ